MHSKRQPTGLSFSQGSNLSFSPAERGDETRRGCESFFHEMQVVFAVDPTMTIVSYRTAVIVLSPNGKVDYVLEG